MPQYGNFYRTKHEVWKLPLTVYLHSHLCVAILALSYFKCVLHPLVKLSKGLLKVQVSHSDTTAGRERKKQTFLMSPSLKHKKLTQNPSDRLLFMPSQSELGQIHSPKLTTGRRKWDFHDKLK